jgi:hypothetical protein
MAGAAVGLASPASAELTDGTYTLTYSEPSSPPPTTVVFTPCGDGCKRFQIPGAVEATEYHLQGNTWTAASKYDNYPVTIDNNTLAGSASGHNYQLVRVG